jgi:hypothetical protein
VQGFFHFVDQNGPYADFKYDKRNTIGQKEKRIISNVPSYITFL